MTITTFIIAFILILVLMVPVSIFVERLRRPPETPEFLYWSNDIPVQYIDVDDLRIRYIKTGEGPNLVLLHTLRTQLDIFQKVIPDLAKDFTVYALDYPGHGFSEIPEQDYRPEFFVKTVEGFLEQLDIEKATLAGISIGGTISLIIAADHNPRVEKVIAINPYDYGKGAGVRRGNIVANLIFGLARIPVLGDTFMRLRNKLIEKKIMQGGVARADALPEAYLDQVFAVGERNGHYQAFLNLIRNAHLWDDAHAVYGQINIPALVIYGAEDWSTESERNKTVSNIPGAIVHQIPEGGHFLSLDQPEVLMKQIKEFSK